MSTFIMLALGTVGVYVLYYGYMISTEIIRISKRGQEKKTETIMVEGAEEDNAFNTIVTKTVTATNDGSYSIGTPEPEQPPVPKEETTEEDNLDPFAQALSSTNNYNEEEEAEEESGEQETGNDDGNADEQQGFSVNEEMPEPEEDKHPPHEEQSTQEEQQHPQEEQSTESADYTEESEEPVHPEEDETFPDDYGEYEGMEEETKEAATAHFERVRAIFETAEDLDIIYHGEMSVEEALAILIDTEETNIEKQANYEHL